MFNKSIHSQKGFTLLELLLVVGIGALLLIGGISTYRLVSEANRATETSRLVLTMKQEIQTLYQGGGSYPAGSLQTALEASGSWPNAGKSPFNTAVTAVGDTDDFTIGVAGVPRGACVKLVRSIYGSGAEVAINGTVITAANAGVTAVATCADPTNDLVWTLI